VTVARRLGMTRAAFSYWLRNAGLGIGGDLRVCGRPYFSEKTIMRLSALRGELAREE
jgi:hypothetical protein